MPHRDAFLLGLASGGDERVFLDPAAGRTKYGTPIGCAADEIWLSSSTASALSPRGSAAAAAAWRDLLAGRAGLPDLCDGIRGRIEAHFGIAGMQTILAGSGTEAVLLSLAVARLFCGTRLTTIIVGAAETGRGIAAAAAGQHFLRHAAFAEVLPGAILDGLADLDVAVETVEIRDASGMLRAPAAVDAELEAKVAAARKAGRDVMIHGVAVSKTGHSAPSLATLEALGKAEPDHIFALVDCCQLRSSPDHIRSALAHGFLVTLTGSKFMGGPSFCGALLLPPQILARLGRSDLPPGLAAYSAQSDWPEKLAAWLRPGALPAANPGLALRWTAALAEIDCFLSWPAELRDDLMRRFSEEVARQAAAAPSLELLPPAPASAENFGFTIVGIAMRHQDGRLFDMAEAAAVQRLLREPDQNDSRPRFHLGQPVAIGGAGIVRVCASAPLVNRLAEQIAAGAKRTEAFAPLAEIIADLFRIWPALLALSRQ